MWLALSLYLALYSGIIFFSYPQWLEQYLTHNRCLQRFTEWMNLPFYWNSCLTYWQMKYPFLMLNFWWALCSTWCYVSYHPSHVSVSVQPTSYHISVSYTMFYRLSKPVNSLFVYGVSNLCLFLHMFLYVVQTFVISYYLIALTSLLFTLHIIIRLNSLSCTYYLSLYFLQHLTLPLQ